MKKFLKRGTMANHKLFVVSMVIVSYVAVTKGYTDCSTPNEELGVASEHEAAQNYRRGSQWPGGVVKYHLNSTLENQDIQQFYFAIAEYHKKTCIRFEPKTTGDSNYTSIELNENVQGGMGSMCMRGGYQYVKIGKTDRNMNTFVHELGHNLCLGHEHQRWDRDAYITYNKCNMSQHGTLTEKQMDNSVKGIYDYSSQMHYDCWECSRGGFPTKPGVKFCGGQVTKGLSVLDADYINDMYECQGCFRHRWVSKTVLKLTRNTFLKLGHIDLNDEEIVPCRVFSNGEIVVGKYDQGYDTCSIAQDDKELEMHKNFEVLTVPDGNSNKDSEYFLAKVVDGNLEVAVSNAVPAGHLPLADGSGYGNEYIAYGTLRNVKAFCHLKFLARNASANVVGKAVWTNAGKSYAYFPFCKHQYQQLDYYVLSCRNTKLNDAGVSDGKDIYTNLKLRHMEYINGTLVPGSTITLIMEVSDDPKSFFIDLCAQPSGGPIILHYNPRYAWDGVKNVTVSSYFSGDKWLDVIGRPQREKFLFPKGKIFQLVIRCEQGVFNFSVNGVNVGMYAYRPALDGAKFIRVHGDVRVIHVDVRGTKKGMEEIVRFKDSNVGSKMKYGVYGAIFAFAVIGVLALFVMAKVVLTQATSKFSAVNTSDDDDTIYVV